MIVADLNIEPRSSFNYNADANPIAFPISKQFLNHSKILNVMKDPTVATAKAQAKRTASAPRRKMSSWATLGDQSPWGAEMQL
jgi:hypothetical protein